MAALRCVCASLAASTSSHSAERRSGGIASPSPRDLPTQFRKSGALRAKSADNHRNGRNSSRSGSRAAAADNDDDGGAATKGRQLWRRELESGSELSNEFESLDAATLERDIERFAKKEERERLWNQSDRASEQTTDGGGGGVVRDVADKVLVADFFFILFVLAWLLAGLAEQIAVHSTRLIDSWLPLWPSVFQPALGVFMAGAIVSAITKKK